MSDLDDYIPSTECLATRFLDEGDPMPAVCRRPRGHQGYHRGATYYTVADPITWEDEE